MHDSCSPIGSTDPSFTSDELYHVFFEQAPDGIFITDEQGHLLAANPHLCQLSGYVHEEILHLSIDDLLCKDNQAQEALRLDDLRTNERLPLECCLRCKDGTLLPIEVSACRLEDGNLFAIVRDLRERKVWEQALRESEARYQATLMSIGDGVITTDAAGQVELMNPVAEALTGWTQTEALGKPLKEVFRIINEYTRGEVENPVQRVLREGIVVGLANHTLLVARDGRELPIADCGAPIRTPEGSLRGVVLVFRDQSEARRAQRAIEEARAFAESIVATVRQPLLVLDGDLRVVSANRYFYHFFQVKPEETLGRSVYELGNRQWEIPKLRQLLEAILPQNTSFDDFEVEHVFERIDERTLLLNARRLHYEDDKTQLILLAIEDITERKRVNRLLEREVHHLKVLHQASQQIAQAGSDPEQVYVAIHNAVAQLMPTEAFVISLCEDARKEAEAVYLIDKDGRYPPQRFPPGAGLTGLIVATGKSLLVEDLVSENDIPSQHFGSPEPVRSLVAVPLRLGEKVIGMVSAQCYRPFAYTPEDQVLLEMLAAHAAAAIENARLVERLRQSEERFRRLAENAQDLIYRYEFLPKRGFTYVSPVATAITGYTPEEHYADPDLGLKIVYPEDRPLLEAYFRGEGKFREPVTLRWIKKDGTIIWTEQRNVSIFDEDGNLIAIEGIARDVTRRKQMEQALIESEQRYRLLFESVPEVVFSLSVEGKFTALNPAFEKLTGWSCREWLGRSFEELISHEDRAFAVREFQRALRGETSSFSEMRIRAKNGETLTIEALGTAQVRDGEIIGVAGFAHDITERKRAEQALRERTEELEALFSLSSILRAAENAEEMLPLALNEVRRVLNADAGALLLLEPDEEHITVVLEDGLPVPHTGRRIPLEGSLSAQVLRTLQPYVCEDYAADSGRFAAMDGVDQIGPAVFVPLQAETQVLGTLMAARLRQPQVRPFSPAEVRLLTAIGDLVGNALHRARLHDQAMARLRRLQSLRAVDRAISASFDPRLTLNVLVSEAVAQLEVDAAAVLLLNPEGLTLEYAAGRGFHTRAIEGTRLRLGESYAGRAALERTTLHVHDLRQAEDAARARLFDREGFVSACFAPTLVKGELRGVLEVFHRQPFEVTQEWLEFLDAMAAQGAIALDNAWLFENMQRAKLDLELAYDVTLEGWVRALDLRDRETEGHTQRVADMVVKLARAMGISEEQMTHIRRGALLHDIGKMAIPDSILLKPGPLTAEEWEVMRKHPLYAYELLQGVSYLRPALEIPYCHHEKWDGSGYPRGLKGDQIPLPARLFAVVDVWDALRSDRPYRKAWLDQAALQYIREQAGKHFDPEVVRVFLRLLDLE